MSNAESVRGNANDSQSNTTESENLYNPDTSWLGQVKWVRTMSGNIAKEWLIGQDRLQEKAVL